VLFRSNPTALLVLTMKNSVALTVTAVVIVSCGQGLVGVFAKWISWPPLAIAWGRCFVAALILWPIVLVKRRQLVKNAPLLIRAINVPRRKWSILVFSGVLLALHWSALFSAFHIAPIGPVVIAVFTYPLMATLFAPHFFG